MSRKIRHKSVVGNRREKRKKNLAHMTTTSSSLSLLNIVKRVRSQHDRCHQSLRGAFLWALCESLAGRIIVTPLLRDNGSEERTSISSNAANRDGRRARFDRHALNIRCLFARHSFAFPCRECPARFSPFTNTKNDLRIAALAEETLTKNIDCFHAWLQCVRPRHRRAPEWW